jgi:uncharacterized protein involved in response to NO
LRPFYLAAALYAALIVPLWAVEFSGLLPAAVLRGPLWHGHEMLFGYTMAVVAGFLFTAVRNWTGLPTPTGLSLAALLALWVAGRVLVLTPFTAASAVVNAAFPVAVGAAIGVPLARSRNARNYFFVGLLLLMGALAAALPLALSGVLALAPRTALVLALDVVLFIMAVMGGRVIPMFTNSGVPGAGAERCAGVERLALAAVLLLFAADLAQAPPALLGAIAAAGAVAHGARLLLWRPWRSAGVPLLWCLHAAYGWIVVHLAARALAAAGWIPESLGLHALGVGAIGGLTLGMMVRSARGHTGRPLAADRYETSAFILVQVAALVRVFGGLVTPGHYFATVQLSALAWSAAFAIFTARYWPILSRPRVDGRPG